jgi:hypothetical protein
MEVLTPRLYFKKKYRVPIYNVHLWVIVTDDVAHEYKKMGRLLGRIDGDDDYNGLCTMNHDKFGIILRQRVIDMTLVAHEVFHLTHRILEWSDANFDPEHHEQGAILHGYLMDLVCGALKGYLTPSSIPTEPAPAT